MIAILLPALLALQASPDAAASDIRVRHECRVARVPNEVRCDMTITLPAASAGEASSFRYECLYPSTRRTGRCLPRTAPPEDASIREQVEGLARLSESLPISRMLQSPGAPEMTYNARFPADWRPSETDTSAED